MNKPLSKFEKLMLLNAHPIKFTFNLIGGAVALYFLWEQRLLYALIPGGVFIFAGTLLSIKNKTRSEVIATTRIGKAFLSYASIWGFVCYSIGHILIPISMWYHKIYLMFIGIIVLALGLVKFPGQKN